MSKVLVIIAHPTETINSSSLTLLKNFLDSYQKANPGDQIVQHNVSVAMPYPLNETALSIYNKTMAKLPLTDGESAFQAGRQQWVAEFISADKYIFVNPMYNMFVPAEMKSYFDIVLQVPQTFHYTPAGTPEGLLHGKKALHIQSSGGNYHGSNGAPDMSHLDMGHQYIKNILADKMKLKL